MTEDESDSLPPRVAVDMPACPEADTPPAWSAPMRSVGAAAPPTAERTCTTPPSVLGPCTSKSVPASPAAVDRASGRSSTMMSRTARFNHAGNR
jgi:hypothetical protein